jgi:phosphatidylglycerophosphate synthase
MEAAAGSRRFAILADGLTAARAISVLPLFWATATEAIGIAAGLLAVAWWTDFFDGRFARSTTFPTRLGPWDLLIDTMVGAALLAGLVASGLIEGVPWGLIGLALFGWYLWQHNPSASMTFQALAYGVFLVTVWSKAPAWIGVLVATIGGIMALDWNRFVGTTLPTFFAGFRIGSSPDEALKTD